jgi:hypothetical protein
MPVAQHMNVQCPGGLRVRLLAVAMGSIMGTMSLDPLTHPPAPAGWSIHYSPACIAEGRFDRVGPLSSPGTAASHSYVTETGALRRYPANDWQPGGIQGRREP